MGSNLAIGALVVLAGVVALALAFVWWKVASLSGPTAAYRAIRLACLLDPRRYWSGLAGACRRLTCAERSRDVAEATLERARR